MEITSILPVIAALFAVAAYVLYNVQIIKGDSKPNAISWGIWVLLAIVNAFSYGAMIDNWITALQFFVGSVACMVTFFIALINKRFERPDKIQWVIAGICLAAIFVWVLFESATGANMIVLIAFIISFIPTLTGVFNDPRKERSFPWIIWTLAFAITLINIILLGKEWMAYLIPSAGLFGHALVGIFSTKKRKMAIEKRAMQYRTFSL